MNDAESMDFVVPGFFEYHRVDDGLPSVEGVFVTDAVIDNRYDAVDDK